MPPARLHILIYGDVQGVFFRAGTQSEARKLGLVGWVRNSEEGGVDVLAEGERSALEKLLEWCSHGPAGASVAKIKHQWLESKKEFREFRIRY